MDLEGASPTSASACISLTCGLLPSPVIGAGDDALPFGLVLTPLGPLPEDLVLHREPLRCEKCGGYIGPHCDVFHGTWRCGLCATENRSLTLAAGPAELEAVQPELSSAVVEYVLRPPPRVNRNVSTSGTGGSGTVAPSVVIFAVDDTAGAAALADVLAAVRAALPLLPPDALVGLLAFGRVVSVYMLGQSDEAAAAGVLEALVMPAADAPVQWELDLLRSRAALALAPRQQCESNVIRAIEALQPAPVLRSGASRHASARAPAGSEGDSSRGLLAAIDLALDLLALTPTAKPPCGLLVIAGLAGPPNYGPGALPRPPKGAQTLQPSRTPARDAATAALRDAGDRLSRAGLATLIACAGPAAFDIEALLGLALPCGGSIALMREPGSAATTAALSTHLAEMFASVGRRGAAGAVTARCSHGMCVEQVMGGASRFKQSDGVAGDAEADGVCFLGAIDPTSTLSLTLDVSDVDAHAVDMRGASTAIGVVQVALRYTRPDGESRLRTYLVSAPFATSAEDWLRSLDVDATALLVARTAALHASATEKLARDGDAIAARAAELGAGLARRYGAPRLSVRRGWLWDSSTTVGFDVGSVPRLPTLLHRLHSLCASPAALNAAADPDVAHAARLLLLTAPAKVAARIAAGPEGADDDTDDDTNTALAALATLSISAAGAREEGGGGESLHRSLDDWCAAIGGIVLHDVIYDGADKYEVCD